MTNYLLFLLKSTLILSLLYLVFSLLMRKETFFRLNRIVLLLMVVSSLLIPFLYSPQLIHPIVQVNLEPIFTSNPIADESVQISEKPAAIQSSMPVTKTEPPVTISTKTILLIVYLSGILVSILMLFYSIGSVLLLFRKARKTIHHGFQLMIVPDDIPAFSFGRYILISQHDYDTNPEAIITHEQSHIRLGHFYDLLLMELIKIIYWFNPLVYRLIRDMKEIHEFQADDHTLTTGIDATQYQMLIIQKCVGSQRFALANSFNHCQIKKRITMMNNQKTSKARRWKVATFLPLLALLLMAFGKTGVKVNPVKEISPQIAAIVSPDSVKKMNSNDFTPPPIFIEIQKEGILLLGELMTLDEFRKRMPLVVKHNPQSKFIVSAASVYYSNMRVVKDILKETGASNIQFTVRYTPPTTFLENQNDSSSRLIEIRKDGNYIDNKLCSLEELREKVESWKKNKEYTSYRMSIKTEKEVPLVRVKEVNEILQNTTVKHVSQSTLQPDEIIYSFVEILPEFPGGKKALKEWISKNIQYPEKAKAKGIQGKVYVNYIINCQGKVEKPMIAKSIDPDLDAEALRLISELPTFTPGKQNGVPVNVYYTTPVNFIIK